MEKTREERRKELTDLIIQEGQEVDPKGYEKRYSFNKEIGGIQLELDYAFNDDKDGDFTLDLNIVDPLDVPVRNYIEIRRLGKMIYILNNKPYVLPIPEESKVDPEELFLEFGKSTLKYIETEPMSKIN